MANAIVHGVYLAIATVLLGAFSNAAVAQTVANASMALSSGTTSEQFGTYSASGTYTPAEAFSDWANPGGYGFVFIPGSAAATSSYGVANVTMDPAVTPYIPGTNFLAIDINTFPTGPNTGKGIAPPITDTVTGLKIGSTVAVSFAWAGAEQTTYTCPTAGCTSEWSVSLGGSPAQETSVATYPSQGFTGWMTATFDFTVTSASEVLSFVASGTPTSGSPPFALLADVSVTTVPEPASVAIIISGIAGLAVLARRRRAGSIASVIA